jgi:4-amino-4-deoxy-L-arabinose transferase-like glycosyltransferase
VLRGWESVTRIQGPLFVLLALLSLAAPMLTSGRARSASALFALAAWVLLVVPVATVEFSARTAVPGFGPLGAAAAVGGWGALVAVRARRSRAKRRLATAV